MVKDLKVSVCVVTYNQSKYIGRCLKSLIDQDVDFDYEIIVGDDASTDGTREIIEEYRKSYPGLIRAIFNEKNIGAVSNMLSVYRSARGEFIAHLDGDDYALPEKLKSQVSALELNPACVICSHDVEIVNANDIGVRPSYRKFPEGVHGIMSLYAQLPFFAHSSKMFLNRFSDDFWGQFQNNTLDIEIHIAQAKFGDIVHLDKVLGGYRLFSGVSSAQKGVSSLIAEGSERIFSNALKDPDLNHSRIRRFYSASLFRFAYQSAVYGDAVRTRFFLKQAYGYDNAFGRRAFFYLLSRPLFLRVFLAVSKMRARKRGFLV